MVFVLNHEKMVRAGKNQKRQAIDLVPQLTSPHRFLGRIHVTPVDLQELCPKFRNRPQTGEIEPSCCDCRDQTLKVPRARSGLMGQSGRQDWRGHGQGTGGRRKSLWADCLWLSPSKSLCVTTTTTMDDCSLNRKTTLHMF